jgi:phosphatidylglycerophosphate synthase
VLSASVQLVLLGAGLALAARPLGWAGRSLALALFAGIAAGTLAGLRRDAPRRRFGIANLVTGARAAAAALLYGIWAEAAVGRLTLDPAARWTVVAVAALALASDGIDGWLARRYGLASSFGARFDMETDALLVLALALLVLAAGQAGAFVLLSGALRYVFLAAGRLAPALRAPLPPSRRRQAICAVQVAFLVTALAPPVPPWAGQGLAALGLGLLVYSFAVDAAGMLLRRRA